MMGKSKQHWQSSSRRRHLTSKISSADPFRELRRIAEKMAISDGFIINGEDLVALADEELVRLWQSNALPNDESIKYHINACTRTRVAMGERPSTGITERLAGSWLPIASPGFPKQEEAPDVEEGTIVLTDTSGRESLHRTQRHFIRWLSSALFCAITIFKKFLASEPNKG